MIGEVCFFVLRRNVLLRVLGACLFVERLVVVLHAQLCEIVANEGIVESESGARNHVLYPSDNRFLVINRTCRPLIARFIAKDIFAGILASSATNCDGDEHKK